MSMHQDIQAELDGHETGNILRLYRKLNDMGRGFAVGDAQDDIDCIDAEEVGGLRYVEPAGVAVYQTPSGTFTLVGDIHGPWAVSIESIR